MNHYKIFYTKNKKKRSDSRGMRETAPFKYFIILYNAEMQILPTLLNQFFDIFYHVLWFVFGCEAFYDVAFTVDKEFGEVPFNLTIE